jgi:uncharacterized protein YihD (DUF1040 family)
MSKRLPYFQFEPAEWLAGDIMFCSIESQGVYVNLMALYWQKDCDLTLEQARKRLNNEKCFDELISEKIIKIDSGKIVIDFLVRQYSTATEKSSINSDNGRKGALKRWQKDSLAIATPLKSDSEPHSETIALREDKIIEDKIIEDKSKMIKEKYDFRKLSFSDTLKPYLDVYGKDFLNDFYRYWAEPNKSGTKFKQELEKTWDLERRLETWAKNDKSFSKSASSRKEDLKYKDSEVWK